VRLTELRRDMKTKLYGQHLVEDVVGKLIEAHRVPGHEPSKALVLSFHGWTGVGKNYVSTMIANRLYKLGVKSKFVKTYIATVDFQSINDVNVYKVSKRLRVNYVHKLPHTVFIKLWDGRFILPDGRFT